MEPTSALGAEGGVPSGEKEGPGVDSVPDISMSGSRLHLDAGSCSIGPQNGVCAVASTMFPDTEIRAP